MAMVGDTLRMKRVVVAAVVLTLAGCASTPTDTVEPGDGPAATESAWDGPVEGEPPMEGEPTPTTAEPQVASFKEKYTYADGVEVEVTRIKHAQVSKQQAAFGEGEKAGDPYVILTFRVRNKSNHRLQAAASATASYGPDGDEAQKVFYGDISGGPDGVILPGKAKSGTQGFLIPARYQNDVVVEVTPDFEHEAAVFSGSVK